MRNAGQSGGRRAYADSLDQLVMDIKPFKEMIAEFGEHKSVFLIGQWRDGSLRNNTAVYDEAWWRFVWGSFSASISFPITITLAAFLDLGNLWCRFMSVLNSVIDSLGGRYAGCWVEETLMKASNLLDITKEPPYPLIHSCLFKPVELIKAARKFATHSYFSIKEKRSHC